MSKKILENYEVSLKGIEKLIADYFGKEVLKTDIKPIAVAVFEAVEKDIVFIASMDPSQNNPQIVKSTKTKSLIATMCYRLANYLYYNNYITEQKKQIVTREFMEVVAAQTSIDIHPAAKIDEQFFIDHGCNVVIGSTCQIGKRCNLFNDVVLGSKNVKTAVNQKRHPTLKSNVTICAGVRVLGNIVIGENVFISPHAVVLEDVADNSQVSIVNQLQITKKINTLPSQKTVVYGVIPKFKNTINILGEGFYNPTVLIKLKNEKALSYQIIYWDKNKIIIKFKNTIPLTYEQTHNAKIILLSNADKVVITQSFGLTKALTTLTT